MTTPPPSGQAANNEIRTKCAEAMGWTKRASLTQPDRQIWVSPEGRGAGFVEYWHIPEYTESCDAAMELVEALRKEGWWVNMVSVELGEDDKPGWEVDCGHKFKDIPNVYKSADTLPLAIATAFLATKGLEP